LTDALFYCDLSFKAIISPEGVIEIMESERQLLAAERARREMEEAAEAPPPEKKLKPSVVPITVTYYEDDAQKKVTLTIRVLNFDERNQAKILAATLANGKFNILPDEHAAFLTALATIYVMWPTQIPDELQKQLHEDEMLALEIYNLIEGHRIARFHGNGGPGKRAPATVRLADLPEGNV
jgi:hypothetical protein